MDKQMEMAFAEGGALDLDTVPDNTQGVDPVSGNEVPLGSMPEEVRDDIPAQLSEGEYVVPADVVRYYGVKYFEDLRAKAKFGYQDMEENGRIGGEPVDGMEVIEPEDDMMFDISELEVEDDGQPMEMAIGGYTGSGGYALSPGDEGYDEMGALGLGAEGISTGYESAGDMPTVEVRSFKNEAGHTIFITYINGKPQTTIPPGYTLQEKTNYQDSVSTTAQPAPQVVSGGDGGGGYAAPTPKAVNYAELTTEEIADMLEEQQSSKMNLVAGAVASINPIMGLFIKGAMMDSARRLENEIERRVNDKATSTSDKAVLEGLLKASKEEKPGLIKRVFGALKDEFFPETEEEAKALEKAKAEDTEVVTTTLEEDEVAAGEVVPVGAIEPVAAGYTPTPEPVGVESPYTGITPEVVAQMENAVSAAAQAREAELKKQQDELDARIASMSSTARVRREKEEAAARQAELARQRSANIQQVSDDSGSSIAELGRRSAPSSAVSASDKAAKAAGATPGAGGQYGMKDGGLASKKKRKKKK